MQIERRKDDHIRICLEKDVQAGRNYWDDVHLKHRSIPVRDLDGIDLGVELLGKKLDYPIVISAMTGGSPQASKYNDLLARAASEFRIGMGVGSQRAGLENPRHTDSYRIVQDHDVPLLLGNLGAPQFASNVKGRRYGLHEVESALEMIGADALCIHLNYLQEIVQPEGDTFVEGFTESLEGITESFGIVVKETGAGITSEDAVLLKDAGVSAIDVGGMSGTTFSAVESYRYDPSGRSKRLGDTLWNWGVPTPISVLSADVGLPVIATGGLRTGLDVARSIALGARAGGMAWVLLKAASKGYGELKKELWNIIEEIRATTFLTGAFDMESLGNVEYSITGISSQLLDLYT